MRQHTLAYSGYLQQRSCSRSGSLAPPQRNTRTHTGVHSTASSIRQHTPAYVSTRQHTSAYVSIRQHPSASVSDAHPLRNTRAHSRVAGAAGPEHASIRPHARQHTSAYVSIRPHARQHTSAYVSIRPHTRQHTSAYVSATAQLQRERARRGADVC
jgi:hypothetical protein